jgi:hypothetical protein
MELVLEQDEIDSLLREALKARGILIPDHNIIRIRRNNKTSTIRVVFMPPRRMPRRVKAVAR